MMVEILLSTTLTFLSALHLPEARTSLLEVDLFQLQTVSRHFRNIPVNEKETLAYFIYMVKSNKSRLDQKSEGSKQLE
ncbi:PREDICTED: histone deacetylase complex subunit SAP30L isoform X2 [Myotis davidii]|uniref:histone deacetylase complex subunit SAP30L isoform X2 n=1 Tax=Myotis davidii TaxID=225400 RepID=UPI000766F6AF|nr:PREDICTED: histone deacetylase complex subunit SAP30L isoform X2 [Myotis davidii]